MVSPDNPDNCHGFKRIRHFGFLANRCKQQALGRCRAVLGLAPKLPQPEPKTPREWMLSLSGVDVARCPRCGSGTLRPVRRLPSLWADAPEAVACEPTFQDSS